MIKNIIFDVGNVLIHYRWREMLLEHGCSEETAVRIGTQVFDNPDKLWSMFDMGMLTEEEVIEKICEKYPEDADIIRWFISNAELMPVSRLAVWEEIKRLKRKGYRIYLLSNYSESLFSKHTKDAAFMSEIDGMVVSYMVQMAKPDKAIYREICSRYNLNPSECVFFDDRQENVQAAVDYGMQSKIADTEESLLKMLEEL